MAKKLNVTDKGKVIGQISLSNSEWKIILQNRIRKAKGLKPIKVKKQSKISRAILKWFQ